MRHARGFTWIEAVVVLVILAALIAILLPALGPARRPSHSMNISHQVRVIGQGHILFSQGNNGYYAGLTREGKLADALPPVEGKSYGADQKIASLSMAILLNGNFFTPGYLINPAETNTLLIKPRLTPGLITPDNFSYSVSRAEDPVADAGRIAEWRDNTNTQAAVVSDRVLKGGAEAGPGEVVAPSLRRSVWTTTDGDWRGSVVFGDNSTTFLTTHTTATKYLNSKEPGAGYSENPKDDLFTPEGPADAFMIRD
jgi:hypothetical protein